MRREQLHYELPERLIAQQPVHPRDASRLLVLDRASGAIRHDRFAQIESHLRPGDCLVLNNTRVVPARFFGRRETGGQIEGLFLHETAAGWSVLLKSGGRLRPDELITLIPPPGEAHGGDPADMPSARLRLIARGQRGEWTVRPEPTAPAHELLARFGRTPLPPYIERTGGPSSDDEERYQTVYAAAPGAVAAPTAGLHFTPELLDRLAARGISRATLTLHVGAGTFLPLDADDLSDHVMHAERFVLPEATAARLNAARAAGGRIIAVGTTSARTLETAARLSVSLAPGGGLLASEGWTDLFIYPPWTFRAIDGLLTNFHLPGSTLLALVMALAGEEAIRRAYAEAIREEYRFYSYGDAMLIL